MDNSLVQRVVKDLLDNIDVLILVVMDNSLVPIIPGSQIGAFKVLILVVMDNSLVLDLIRQH